MPDDFAPFLAAIIAAPDDDLPRLIAADWLDEHDEGARAEFVRVQCELARIISELRSDEPCDTPGCDCKSLDALRRRERELAREHGLSWAEDFGPQGQIGLVGDLTHRIYFGDHGESQIDCTYTRGFVSEITCSWADWQRHADAIRKATPLRRVRLATWVPVATLSIDRGGLWLIHGYPGIEFELPTIPQTNIARFREMQREFAREIVEQFRVDNSRRFFPVSSR